VCLYGRKRQFYRTEIKPAQIEREIRRFRAAIRLALRQLKSLQTATAALVSGSAVSIVDVHRMLLADASLLAKVEETITADCVNAEWAVKVVTDSYVAKFKAMPDEHLRSRYVDIEDIAERMLTALGGGRNSRIKLEKNSIIVAKEINPSTLIELAASDPIGLVTEHGGWTSHTFILAREIRIPGVTGVRQVLRKVQTGDTAIIDGLNGRMILNPSAKTLAEYRTIESDFQRSVDPGRAADDSTAKTLDGREIRIRANVDFPSAYKFARRQGARGIGLYRSEFLFNQFRGFPTEAEQIEAYSSIADMAGDDRVKIRTFDLSADQLADQNFEKEKNPALGLRAIRLSLAFPTYFRTQLRAILIASHGRMIDIVLPMIADVSQIREARKFLDEETQELERKGIRVGSPRLGAMVEVPAAVFVIDEIASEVEFLCLGTNDLVQYFLAVDRDNESVADWFQTLHPAVIRAVKATLDAGIRHKIPVIVCGEMAGSPFYTPLLIGLGATELSMNVNSVSRIRKIIKGISHAETIPLGESLNKCSTAEESLAAMKQALNEKWGHLVPPDLVNSRGR
ncbi:MAG: phosphoenolpyruvate--protein phosphotransferase, partial [Acidobacteriota bacterium]